MKLNRLSARQVATLNTPGRYADGGGLYLQIAPSTVEPGAVTKAWVFRYQLHGRNRHMGLGSLDTFTLAEARQRAKRMRQLIADGLDPIEERRKAQAEAREAAARRVTFKAAAEAYIKAHEPSWKNGKHKAQWRSTLAAYVYPHIGAVAVPDVATSHVMRVLEPIWRDKPETAGRVRGRIEAILDSAKSRGLRSGDNPAQWKNHLDKLLPAKSKIQRVKHQPAMPFADVPGFMAELRKLESVSARALEFAILTAARTSEVIGAKWDEIDLEAKTWTIPPSRMKTGRPHTVPLSPRALAILKALPRPSKTQPQWVFPGARRGKPLSNMAMLECLRGLRDGLTVHGFRSSFRDWCGEATNFPREIAEAALAHANKDKTEAAYRRGDALQKRRKLMAAWDAYLAKPKPAGNVHQLHGRKATA